LDQQKIASTMAILATAFVVNHGPAVSNYSTALTHAGTENTQVLPTKEAVKAEATTGRCASNVECDALIPYRDSGPWTASCAWFGSRDLPAPRRAESIRLDGNEPESIGVHWQDWCLPSGKELPALSFMVVMVPDPVTTHLALYFDRTIEAVEAAEQQHGFFLDRYWLPWSLPSGAAAAGDTSQDLRINAILNGFKSNQPGVMIFNSVLNREPCEPTDRARNSCMTYVFLVSESPTSGINKAQFENAVKYAHVLSDPRRPSVHVVGPFFSGSVPSVIMVTRGLQKDDSALDFVSGTMSSGTQSCALRSGLGKDISFKKTLHDDGDAENFLLNFLQQRGLTVNGGNVAILQEDETRYGSSLDSPEAQFNCPTHATTLPNVRYIKFPRELSRLRNASADNFGGTPLVPGQPETLPSDGISWHWKDVSKGEDSVPSFSAQQESLSQQAVLLSISDMIRQENIKYLGIAATDIFDILFLSKFLKIAAPNTRLFVLDADVLMVRTSSEGKELDGTLAVTTYPLFARNGDWTQDVDPNDRANGKTRRRQSSVDIFPSRVAEGVYNAVLFELDPGNKKAREYINPLATGPATNRPPIWLTMVGRNGFWPVSLRENAGVKEQPAPTPDPSVLLATDSHDRLTFDPPDGATLLLEWILLAWSFIHLLSMRCAIPGSHAWFRQCQIRSRANDRDYAQHQMYYLLCGTLAMSAMLFLIAIPYAALSRNGEIAFSRPTWCRWLFPMFYLAIASTGAGLLFAAGVISSRIKSKPVSAWYQLPSWIIYLVVLTVWAWLNFRRGAEGIFFAQRSFYLSNDVSPLLPVELLLLMYYVWAWMFIRKVRLSESKQVQVPELALLGAGAEEMKSTLEQLETSTDNLAFSPRVMPWMVGAFLLVFFLMIRPWEVLRSIEGSAYDFLVVLLVAFICLLIVAAWGRYLYIWSRLRTVLRGLERSPLRHAFSRFPKTYSWSQLWYENADRRAYTISARSVECYRALVSRSGSNKAGVQVSADMTREFENVVRSDDGTPKDTDKCDAVARLQTTFARVATQILIAGLAGRWAYEGGSDSFDLARERQSVQTSMSRDAECKLLAEEFIALRFVGLIHYESAQLKNLAVLLAVGFILALGAVGSYPFLAVRECVWTLAAIFVIFGAAIIISFAQMDRDPIMSRLSGTDAGKLDWSFYFRVLSFGGLPLLALLASQFPTIGRSLFSWLEPALNALH
jgi:hypothetical protein